MDTIMGIYVVLLIIGLALFLLICPYLENRKLKKELKSVKNELELVRGLLLAYEDQYGEDLANERIKNFLKKLGITEENPLVVKMKKREMDGIKK